MVDLDHERDLVSVFSAHHSQNTEGGADHVASAFDSEFNDSGGVEARGVFGERCSGTVFDALVNREDADVSGTAESTVVKHFLQAVEDFVISVGLAVDAINEIGTREVNLGFVDCLAFMSEEVFGFVA